MDDFNKTFNELVELQKTDPAKFEERRKEILQANIDKLCKNTPEKLERYRAMQWRIDQEMLKYKNPITKYNKMVEMFWKQFEEFQKGLKTLETIKTKQPEKPATADIIQFTKLNK